MAVVSANHPSEMVTMRSGIISGIGGIVVGAGLIAFAIFFPVRPGSSSSSRVYLLGCALMALAWGLVRLQSGRVNAKQQEQRQSKRDP